METEPRRSLGAQKTFSSTSCGRRKKPKKQNRRSSFFYSLDRGVFRNMGREFLWGPKKSSSTSCGRKKKPNKQIGWSGLPFLTARLLNCSLFEPLRPQTNMKFIMEAGWFWCCHEEGKILNAGLLIIESLFYHQNNNR